MQNMDINVTETPERWVILKLPNNYYKVLGTWSGGYLYGDRWKLNSGIKKVEEDDEFYYFIGYSESCYKCHKTKYGMVTSYGLYILNEIIKQGKGEIEVIKNMTDISILP